MAKLIRIDAATLEKLKKLEKDTGNSLETIIRQAIDTFFRDKVLKSINDSYEAMRQDPKQWEEELEERKLWEITLSDGLNDL